MVPFKTAMALGASLMSTLETLHRIAGIIHGDIHLGNVMVELNTSGEFNLKLIDFGRAFPNLPMPSEPKYPLASFYHYMFSVWEIEGYYAAARDDVVRALQLVAHLMNPPEYFDMEERLQRLGPNMLLKFKKTANIFMVYPHKLTSGQTTNSVTASDGSFDPVSKLKVAPETSAKIRENLAKILQIAQKMNNVNSIPPYEEIRLLFEELYDLSTEVSEPSQNSPTESNSSSNQQDSGSQPE
jgi:hypothetical protein